ncbi:tyrosine-protein phosphatase [Candidatus Allofournierella excrementigallinarum]|uniref:tyrosine-protein phosphatase n=1 Tax=Candidatus Allofournierella excrementigallinarum TaxID=2838592 RepID=UPI00374FDA90
MSMIRRIPMEGVMNLRDLGGFACPGGCTRWGCIYRSAALNSATPGDVEKLRLRGVKLVLDLRNPQEVRARPDTLIPGAQNLNFPLLGDYPLDRIPVNDTVRSTKSLHRMYRLVLRHGGEGILGAVRALLACDGAVLFHCAAGKDRTGIFTMLLLSLAGVDWVDILADYTVSELYLEGYTADISGSNVHNMRMLRSFLEKEYGSPREYLLGLGASEGELEAFRRRFVCSEGDTQQSCW